MQPLGRKHTVASDVDQPYGEAGEEGRPVVVNVKVKELEVEDRPREKAMAHGIGSLSTADLFAVILRTGQQGYPITQLCRELMKANDNSLFNLERRTRDELLEIDGIGPAKALQIEAVMELILNINTDITPEEATLLYIGLSTDTGCFQYANTNAATFRAGAELLRLGADNRLVNRVFFRSASRARLQLESMIYAGMGFFREGKITVATVTLEMMEKAGATEDDCDDLAGLAGRVEGSVVNVTIKEQADGNCKISVRSNPEVSSSQICAVFGGGGHDMAAGCTIMGTPEKARELLLQVIDEVWK